MAKPTKKIVRRKKASPWPWLIALGVALLIAVPVGVRAVQSANLPGESFRSLGNAHIGEGAQTPTYNTDPPTSGPHYPNIANWGSYDYVLPDPLLVHNMEDGGVILWYPYGTPEENEEHIRTLEQVARSYRRTVIAPRENLEGQYVLTAWTRLQRFDEYDEEGKRAFLQAFEGIDHHPRGF
jgi:hypothetical protein